MNRLGTTLAWVLSLALSAAGCTAGDDPSTPPVDQTETPIIGGVPTTEPLAVGALGMVTGRTFEAFCSGTLIDPQWVLTAAHCLDWDGVEEIEIQFFMGANTTDLASATLAEVDGFITHPTWNPYAEETWVDVGLLHLTEPVARIAPLPMNTTDLEERVSDPITWVGFGVNDSSTYEGAGVKRTADAVLGEVWMEVFFADANPDGQLPCFGDSGGPTLMEVEGRLHVVGVASYVSDELCSEWVAAARVDTYAPWVTRIMAEGIPADGGDLEGECDLMGGECGEGACMLNDDHLTQCFPSEGLAIGDPCDGDLWPEVVDCVDGALCLELPEAYGGHSCYAYCHDASDCERDEECVRLSNDREITIGACITREIEGEGCQLTGGDCPAGMTCYPVSETENGCIPNDGLGLGEYCDADYWEDDVLPCEDGLLCVPLDDSYTTGMCMAFCYSDLDCGGVDVCWTDIFEGFPGLGLCWADEDSDDRDGDGWVYYDDCDDWDYWVNPGMPEMCNDWIDNNCNGAVDEGCGEDSEDWDGDGWAYYEDCDDWNQWINPGVPEYCGDRIDNDCDGWIDEGCGGDDDDDDDSDGWRYDEDCDDSNYWVNPGMTERCDDRIDNNCDGWIDEGCSGDDDDADRDGFPGWNDCDDRDPLVFPGAPEVCGDRVDNDCDGQVDEGCGSSCNDLDEDGYCAVNDCDNEDPSIHPGAEEICGDRLDNDCDGVIDDACTPEVCPDYDADGVCAPEDCNDFDASTSPNAEELCDDFIDNDCNGWVDERCGYYCDDEDGDGYCADVDCDDLDPTIHPFNNERCHDHLDNDCDGAIDEFCGDACVDEDHDGYCAEIDCAEDDASRYPGAPETCGDEVDNDCDGSVDETCFCLDRDGDGYCADEDCSDIDPNVHPSAMELCGDEIDNNCNGQADDDDLKTPCVSADEREASEEEQADTELIGCSTTGAGPGGFFAWGWALVTMLWISRRRYGKNG